MKWSCWRSGGHPAHSPPSGPENPGMQMHWTRCGLPGSESEPDGQSTHASAPTASMYVPAPQ
eukprot:1879781-Rhodomonas_salina.1